LSSCLGGRLSKKRQRLPNSDQIVTDILRTQPAATALKSPSISLELSTFRHLAFDSSVWFLSNRAMITCPFCKRSNYRLSHRKDICELAASWLGIRPYRCSECQERFWQIRHRAWDGSLGSFISILAS
jgi:hypothetical protein